MRKLLAIVTSTALLLSMVGPVSAVGPKVREKGHNTDNIPSSLSERQAQLKQAAQEAVLSGTAKAQGANQVVKVAPGQYAELAFEGSDDILTLLGEFGDEPATHNHGTEEEPVLINHGGDAGPSHNEIPAPDRTVDNTTIWEEDFSQAYYEQLLYDTGTDPSMANFYKELSSGRYTVDGIVGDWVEVPNNAAAYGSDYCGSIVCRDTWLFVRDQVNAWYQSLLDSGKTAEQIDAELARFDVWDRYDHDGDGDFDEPDGYIDHFQSVHAGEGQETGGGAQGSDAIWSHRWYVQLTQIGAGGPTLDDGTEVPFGGVQLGGSKYWIGDYTIEPENGGVGVFAHEFAHDLGLPDLYDTSGNTGGAENSTGFWTLMSSGSYGSSGVPADGIGTRPTHMGAWEKFQLGWLNYAVARRGKTTAIRLGPADTNTRQAQGAFVVLPRKSVSTSIGAPFEGSKFYYSGSGDDLDNVMYKSATLAAGSTLTAKVRYDIETDWDYAYVVVSTDGGSTWTGVETNRSTDTNPNGSNFGNGITGASTGWVDLTADLSPYTGSVLVGFRYWTDGAVVEPGISIDNISIAGGPVDGAETDAGWTFDPAGGFRVSSGTEIESFAQYYVLENRQYRGYDDSLRTGPYNFGFLNTRPDWVEHFNYEDGLLISLWDTSHSDNNVGDHPGEGLLLPIDAHPELEHWSGTELLLRPRILARDSTFGFEPVPALTLHNNGVPTALAAKPAVSVFDDTKTWWYNSDGHGATGAHPGRYQPGWASVNPPKTGTTIEIIDVSPTGFWQIAVRAGR